MRALAHHLAAQGCTVRLSLPDGNDKRDIANFPDAPSAWQWVKDGIVQEELPQEVPDDEERPVLRLNAKGLATALDTLGVEFRYNIRSASTEYSDDTGKTWVPSDDRREARYRETMSERFAYEAERGKKRALWFSKDHYQDRLNSLLHDREVDPFVLWLESLPPWDGEGRVETWLTRLVETEDVYLTQWASQFLCLGAVWRAYEPGCKLDEIPIIIGAQRTGKSTIPRLLLPQDKDKKDWFGDQLDFSADAKTRVEMTLGKVIIEIQELEGLKEQRHATVKAFLSRQNDGGLRLAYRRNPESRPRRFIFIGTTDRMDSALPNDPAGLRRFVPVVVRRSVASPEKVMDYIRDQIWAEALVLYRDGVSPALPEELITPHREAVQRHRDVDEVMEERIETLMDSRALNPDGMRFSDTLAYTGIARSDEEQNTVTGAVSRRVKQALNNRGWKVRQANITRADGRKERARLWMPPLTPK